MSQVAKMVVEALDMSHNLRFIATVETRKDKRVEITTINGMKWIIPTRD